MELICQGAFATKGGVFVGCSNFGSSQKPEISRGRMRVEVTPTFLQLVACLDLLICKTCSW